MKSRVQYIDALRGFGILLVVAGHLIQYNYSQCYTTPVFNIIYSFHMPLFFFISGMTMGICKRKNDYCKYSLLDYFYDIYKKFRILIIPTISWVMLVPIFFTTDISISTDLKKLWFLPTLFNVYIIYYTIQLLCFLPQKGFVFVKVIIYISAIVIFLVLKNFTLMYFVCFISGVYYMRYENIIIKNKFLNWIYGGG